MRTNSELTYKLSRWLDIALSTCDYLVSVFPIDKDYSVSVERDKDEVYLEKDGEVVKEFDSNNYNNANELSEDILKRINK